MNVSIFKKTLAFLLDAIPILFILGVLLSLFVGDMLKESHEDYDNKVAIYQENVDAYYAALDVHYQDLLDEIITQDDYDTLSTDLRDDFTDANNETETMIFSYYLDVILCFLVSYLLIKYLYNLFAKGQTLGLKMMNLEMVGRINWFTLLLREVFWREIYWIFTFGIGFWIDFGMLLLTKKQKTLRDMFSNTQIIHQGTSYPF